MTQDALIGLKFEVGGGLGKMSGRILGKAGTLYLVQREGASHFELLELEDLRSAKFYSTLESGAAGKDCESPTGAEPGAPSDASAPTGGGDEKPRKRLSEQIRRAVSGRE